MNRFADLNDSSKKSSKQDENCETCTDFKDWMKKPNLNKKFSDEELNSLDLDSKNDYYNKCPLFRDQLGRAAWSYLHTMAAYYPKQPSEQEKSSMKGFIDSFAQFFPCHECAADFKEEYFVVVFFFLIKTRAFKLKYGLARKTKTNLFFFCEK